MNKIQYTKVEHYYKISFNEKSLGELIMLEGGQYSWFPPNFNGSCLDVWVIRDIANKIDELNFGNF